MVFAALEGAWIKSLDALTALDPAAFDELADELKEEHQIPPRITKAILNEVQGRQPVLCAPSATEAQQLSPFDQRQEGSARRKKILAAPPPVIRYPPRFPPRCPAGELAAALAAALAAGSLTGGRR